MKGKIIGYWITTGLVALAFGPGGVMDFMAGPEVAAIMSHLGYPLYMARILGVFKILGTVAVLAPGMARIKEWAYAGIAIDLIGAAASHWAVGDGPKDVLPPLVLLVVTAASWGLRPPSRVVGQLFAGPGAQPAPGAAAA
jgi:uncharacterized membrane protein YphA (DoxX/SURF4 family)